MRSRLRQRRSVFQLGAHLRQTLSFQSDVLFSLDDGTVDGLTTHRFRNGSAEPHLERYLNIRIPLPDDQNGGNTILLRRCVGERERPLLMYPRLEAFGLELWFRSRWYGADRDQRDRYLKTMPTTTHLGILCVVWEVSASVRRAKLTSLQPQTPNSEMAR